MKTSLIIIFISVLSFSYQNLVERKPQRTLSQSTLDKIKSKASWNPYEIHENPLIKLSEKQIKSLLGAELMVTKEKKKHNMIMTIDQDDHSETFDVPHEFDSRKHWPDCIAKIRKQEHCGSCWAFSASSTLSDRFCIASKGMIREIFSPQYMVSCDDSNKGCKGGLLDKAWNFLENQGITNESCTPYVSGDGKTIPRCQNSCSGNQKFRLFKVRKGSSKPLTCALQIQREILENGPVQTGFEVYEDFLHYKNGIYHYADGIIMGGHAVKIVGWGQEKGTNYWIVANSWGPEWGENGYFRIAFGECSIEDNAFVGIPDLLSANSFLR